jgi:lysophospholipase L1-like esterase
MAKVILCYGDSNTFGAAVVERPDDRYPYEERWTGVLAAALGGGWRVIEEGLNGRTVVRDDPVEGEFLNGKTYLLPCILSHRPLDIVTIMLGTNDLKARFSLSAWDIAEGLGNLIGIIRKAAVGRRSSTPAILIIAPPPILPEIPLHGDMFVGAYEKSQQLAKRYEAVAEKTGVHFLAAGSIVKSSKVDGFHLEPGAHLELGKAVAAKIRTIFP